MVGTANDYSNPNNWHKCPDKNEMPHEADVIYFIGTTAANPDGGDIASIDEPTLRQPFLGDFETSIFSPFCNVFFPWWRQVDTTAVFKHTPEEVDRMQYDEPRTIIMANHSFLLVIHRVQK